MRVSSLPPLLALLLGPPALAQATEPAVPEESWNAFPGKEAPPPPEDAKPDFMSGKPLLPRPSKPPKPPLPPNRVSLFSARLLPPGEKALAASVGFPFFGAKAYYGVLPWLDVGLGVDSYYVQLTGVHAHARAALAQGEHWALSAAFEGGYTFFLHPAVEDFQGARFVTGRRNWNLLPGLVASYQGRSPQAMRLFLDVRYHLAIDTEPLMHTPLGGVSGTQVAGNVPVRLGFEVPFSEHKSYVIMVGGDFHGRPEDSGFMPFVSGGLIFSL
jgi:hypothetical protein